jgi:hypothetical protein
MNPVYLLAVIGVFLFLGLVFEVLLGLRKIKFKGALHQKVHRWTAYTLLVLAALHGIYAMGTLVFGWF